MEAIASRLEAIATGNKDGNLVFFVAYPLQQFRRQPQADLLCLSALGAQWHQLVEGFAFRTRLKFSLRGKPPRHTVSMNQDLVGVLPFEELFSKALCRFPLSLVGSCRGVML